jgi:E3 ubiquitin-protein ligase TRIP12
MAMIDIGSLNGNLMKVLSDLQALVNQYQLMASRQANSPQGFEAAKSELTYNGVKLEDLCLNFTLPGYDDYELMPGGVHKDVDLDNLQLYIDLVIKTYLIDSVLPYVESFREGFNMVRLASPSSCPSRS